MWYPSPMMHCARPRLHTGIVLKVGQVTHLHCLEVLPEVRHRHPAQNSDFYFSLTSSLLCFPSCSPALIISLLFSFSFAFIILFVCSATYTLWCYSTWNLVPLTSGANLKFKTSALVGPGYCLEIQNFYCVSRSSVLLSITFVLPFFLPSLPLSYYLLHPFLSAYPPKSLLILFSFLFNFLSLLFILPSILS